MDLVEKLREVSVEVHKKRRFAKNEASTRNYLIDPFIRALGYDPNEPNEVEPEFTADFVVGNRKVDYALKKEGRPIIFVEFKPATKHLSYKHTVQLQYYFSTKLDVRFGIVTNGLEYRFFADIDNPNVMDDESFLTVDMLNWDERLIQEIATFSKSGFDSERALSAARQLKYGGEIRQRIESEFEQPSRDLIKHFAKDLYTGSFSNAVVKEFTPIIKRAWQQIVRDKDTESSDTTPPPRVETPKDESTTIRGGIQPFDHSSKSALARKEISVITNYFSKKLDKPINATLILDKTNPSKFKIKFNDVEYDNPSSAGAAAKVHVNPGISEKGRSTRGPEFWLFEDPQTHEHRPISELFRDEALLNRLLLS
ncbi:MAG: type I restriction enzyme HsdR N-terminal domain-containing protein [Chloroflexota bacterium]|nr:type I restriction enzyme HsdR N-terminal domain-containing protein [Chloroflexota bacterium]